MQTLKESFKILESKTSLSVNDLVKEIGDFGLAFIGLILVIPSALPVPATYYSTPIAIIVFLIGLSIMFSKTLIPKKWAKKKIKITNLKKIHSKLSGLLIFFDRTSKKRLSFLFNRYFLGFLIILMSVFMSIPYPLTDTLPAMALFFIFFSIINEDGYYLVFGIFVGLIAIIVSILALTLGFLVVKEFLRSLISFL